MSDNFEVGTEVTSDAAAERIPVGTVVLTRHPVYDMPVVALRWQDAFGKLWWSVAGSANSLTKTGDLRRSVRNAPLKIVSMETPEWRQRMLDVAVPLREDKA